MLETSRPLENKDVLRNSIVTLGLPANEVIKKLSVQLKGSTVVTITSGTPLADSMSIFDNLIPQISVTVGGSQGIIKQVKPHLLRMQQLFATGSLPTRRCTTGATVDDNPMTDAGFTYPTSTQISSFIEEIEVLFEHPWAATLQGKEDTWLDLRGKTTGVIQFTIGDYTAFQAFGNTAVISFSSQSSTLSVSAICAVGVPENKKFSIYKQTTSQEAFSSQTSNRKVKLDTAGATSDIFLFARDGFGGGAALNSGKRPNNNIIDRIILKYNGKVDVKDFYFMQLQNMNRNEYGIQAPFASSISAIDGVVHLNLLTAKDLSTALDSSKATDTLELYLSTKAANGTVTSYANPATVDIMQGQIIRP